MAQTNVLPPAVPGLQTGADVITPLRTFGMGGDEPYARALRTAGSLVLSAYDAEAGAGIRHRDLDFGRWMSAADATDMSLIEEGESPLLDIGCGPGRMVRAALTAGHRALGVDVSPAAVEIALASGLPVLHRSVFDPLPLEGAWATLLLVDGNIGIDGDPDALLARCAELLAPHGRLLVETHPDPQRDAVFSCTVADGEGHVSAPFPWAEIGADALARRARGMGLRTAVSWSRDGRSFVHLAER
jgi:SAM-dependent methyltransferase